jgi:hypothetical protein
VPLALFYSSIKLSSRRAHVSLTTRRRSENGTGTARVSPRAVLSIQRALEVAGGGIHSRWGPPKAQAPCRGRDENDLYDEFGLPA